MFERYLLLLFSLVIVDECPADSLLHAIMGHCLVDCGVISTYPCLKCIQRHVFLRWIWKCRVVVNHNPVQERGYIYYYTCDINLSPSTLFLPHAALDLGYYSLNGLYCDQAYFHIYAFFIDLCRDNVSWVAPCQQNLHSSSKFVPLRECKELYAFWTSILCIYAGMTDMHSGLKCAMNGSARASTWTYRSLSSQSRIGCKSRESPSLSFRVCQSLERVGFLIVMCCW